eukprot:1181024-Prorocentrum_minimum.AAC.7
MVDLLGRELVVFATLVILLSVGFSAKLPALTLGSSVSTLLLLSMFVRDKRLPAVLHKLLKSLSAGAHGDQSCEGRENIPTGGTSHVRGERVYLQGGPVT